MEMNVDKEVLDELQQANLYRLVVEQLNSLSERSGPAATLIPLPPEFPLEDLQKYMPHRRHMSSAMSTSIPAHFFRYCEQQMDLVGFADNAGCFVNTSGMTAVMIFNIGTPEKPGHADRTAKLALEKTAAFEALLAVAGPHRNSFEQKAMAEWLEDWLPNLTAWENSTTEQSMIKAIQAVRQIDIKTIRNVGSSVENLSQTKEAFEKISAESQHTLPSEFKYTCVPYQGLSERTFKLRLTVNTGNDKISMKLAIRNLEAAVQDMADELAAIVEGGVKDVPVYVGSFAISK
jgi:uncharacterized protein YfdQ (DUF2303 family)